jgi:peptidoglycan/LPS O-acetylase OafA/YrhL
LRGVDHLRAYAAILLVFFHGLNVLRWVGGPPSKEVWIYTKNPIADLVIEGQTAVGLFMVLSGFIFSVGAANHDVLYWPFLRNRLLRIYPLFLVMIAVAIAAQPRGFTFLGLLQTLFFQANLPGALNGEPFSGMFWGVAVEIQFYLIFPFLHRELERQGPKWALAAIVLFTILRGAAFTLGTSTARDISYWYLLSRIDEFLLGMLAARVYLRNRDRKLPWGLFVLGATALVLGAVVGVNALGGGIARGAWLLHWPTVEGLVWAVFIVAYVPFAMRLSGPVSRAIARLGTFSYSIYLLNGAILTLVPRYLPFHATSGTGASETSLYVVTFVLPVLLPLAALSYYVVERPFLALRGRYLTPLSTTARPAE